MDTAANPPAAEVVRGGVSFPGIRRGDRIVWTQPDNARIFVIVSRVSANRQIAWLKCHHGDKTWVRRHSLPLYPSMRHQHWTTEDIKEAK